MRRSRARDGRGSLDSHSVGLAGNCLMLSELLSLSVFQLLRLENGNNNVPTS